MSFFKKNTFSVYNDDSPEVLKRRLNSHLSPWNDFSNFKKNKTDNIYEGVVGKKIFYFRKIIYGSSSFNPEFTGTIEKHGQGSKITIIKELNAGIKVVLVLMIAFTLLMAVMTTIDVVRSGKDYGTPIIGWVICVGLSFISRIVISGNPQATYKEIEMLFEEE